MSIKKALKEIHKIQMQNYYTANEFRSNSIIGKGRGMYWIWTDLTFEELKKTESKHNGEVPISKLIEHRAELENICKIKNGNFRVIYNGIGGYNGTEKKNNNSYNLRSRINQEFNSADFRTGTLNIINRNNYDANNWGVSFVNFDEIQNILVQLPKYDNTVSHYEEYANILELSWRIEFGHPILNRF